MRDRALLLIGWAGALRRSELVALQVGDLSFEPEGGRADDSALDDRSRGRRRHRRAGLEGDFAGHSLRAGFATAAARAGRSEAAIMRHGR